ncbi:MAG: hypothetical protein KTR14_08130 [Vampirovibrio sp.]|nr:hypothetical protein [Vampirovibrio sp.]
MKTVHTRDRWINKVLPSFLATVLSLSGIFVLGASIPSHARSTATPWTNEIGPQSLVYAASTTVDVQRAIGHPDEVVKSQQMYPVVENYIYYEEGGTGAATVMVFENGLLVGMHYRSPSNQMVDLTYFLLNNGDRRLNYPALAGFRGYSPYFPLYQAPF